MSAKIDDSTVIKLQVKTDMRGRKSPAVVLRRGVEHTFFHLARGRNADRILRQGLIPKRGPRSRKMEEKRTVVYLFLTMWDALNSLDDMYGDEFDKDLALLEVRLKPEEVEVILEEDQAVSHEPIAPERISLAYRYLWGEEALNALEARERRRVLGPLSRLQYHVTPARNLKSIFAEGLKPRVGARGRKLGEHPGVFLFPTRVDAEDAVANWLGDECSEGTRLALLKVLVPATAKVSADPAAGYETIITDMVPPSHLELVTDNL